jgi:GNAT superfamily N-acetyltransferase
LTRLNSSQFQVLDRYERVAPFIQATSEASDNNRDLLGFLPRGLFDEYARRNDLFVLAAMDGAELKFAGHLLFDRKHPRAKVLQLFVASEYRGRRCARLLVEHLVKMLTREGFTSIYARVGEDMSEANERWGALGFRVQRTEPGGATTGRVIVVRVRELESPQLFPTRVIDPADPLGIIRTPTTEIPLFLIDLNVLFDLSPQRKRHEEAILLFKAERADFCKLAISDELLTELARSATPGRPDSMMDLARTFSTFPVSKAKAGDAVFDELHKLVFPQKTAASLGANDVSDLRHLITAIENGLSGLVTNDRASLHASAAIEARFDIQVISPKGFIPPESAGLVTTAFETSSANLALTTMAQSDEADVRALLSRLQVPASAVASGWLSPLSGRQVFTSYVIRNGSDLLAYMTWPALKQDGAVVVRAALDETRAFSREAAHGVVMHCMNMNVGGPTTLKLVTPGNQVFVHDVARSVGFGGVPGSKDLTKLALGRVITKATWNQCRSELAVIARLKIDSHLPVFRRMDQQIGYITPNGDSGFETLERMETLLTPTLFCLPGRPAVVTPIRHEFASRLLGHSPQGSLLPLPAANLFRERHYLSGSSNFQQLKRGNLILFYESKHPRSRGELVAIARVRRSYLKEVSALDDSDLGRSVLTPDTLPEIGRETLKTVTVFDNLFRLPAPISLDRLQDLGCGRPNDLIKTRPISDTQLQAILAEAFEIHDR